MTAPHKVVFLFDVDNTLLDNDRVRGDLQEQFDRHFGRETSNRYWEIYEHLRDELGYADYLLAMQRFRRHHMYNPYVLKMAGFLLDYPFAQRLYPGAIEVLKHCAKWGPAVILSDGDIVLQPRKIERSGLWEAVEGRVQIYIKKDRELTHVEDSYPSDHYVLIDDKLQILHKIKRMWGHRLTTVFAMQGHYANDTKVLAEVPAADISITAIAELRNFDLAAILAAAKPDPKGTMPLAGG